MHYYCLSSREEAFYPYLYLALLLHRGDGFKAIASRLNGGKMEITVGRLERLNLRGLFRIAELGRLLNNSHESQVVVVSVH